MRTKTYEPFFLNNNSFTIFYSLFYYKLQFIKIEYQSENLFAIPKMNSLFLKNIIIFIVGFCIREKDEIRGIISLLMWENKITQSEHFVERCRMSQKKTEVDRRKQNNNHRKQRLHQVYIPLKIREILLIKFVKIKVFYF